MTDYKLVPIGPTPEMVEAAEDAYMPFGDMEMAIRMAVLAAPAVQGEPVGFCEDTALSLAERTFSSEVDEQLAEDVIQYARRLHTLYTAPQPAEQQPALAKYQPCGCVVCTCEHETQCQGCGAHHCGTHPVGQIPAPAYMQPAEQQPIPSSLAHDASIHLTNWLNMNLCECESGHTCGYTEVRRTRDALLAVAEQQQAPDVGELIEALEELMLRAHPAYVHDDLMREKLIAARELGHAALSSHREQQPAPDVAMRVMEALAAILRKAQGRTDTETGECIDVGAECMAIRREFDRSSKAARGVSGLVEAAEAALDEVEKIMHEAYNSAEPVCCGREGSECCGSPEPEWSEFDQNTMDRLAPHQRALTAALAAHRKGGGV